MISTVPASGVKVKVTGNLTSTTTHLCNEAVNRSLDRIRSTDEGKDAPVLRIGSRSGQMGDGSKDKRSCAKRNVAISDIHISEVLCRLPYTLSYSLRTRIIFCGIGQSEQGKWNGQPHVA